LTARVVTVVVIAAAAVALSCSGPTPVDQPKQPPSPTGAPFFSRPGNIWTTPVPVDAPADPRSAEYINSLLEAPSPVVSIRQFSVPVYIAQEGSPRFTIRPTSEFTPPDFVLDNVPIPEHVLPDPEDDGHMVIFDATSDCVYEFYRPGRTVDGWTAEWANAISGDGDGIYPDGLSTRASGFSSGAGLIWPDELRAGHIPHVLTFAYPFTSSSGPVDPATRTDGRTNSRAALPIGAHLVLDPEIDIDALGLPQAERTLAKALQEYGMILSDTSGGFTLYAVNPLSFPGDPYISLWGDTPWADLSAIPFHRMKVLPLGEPRSRYTGPPIANRCNGLDDEPR
jgi:hypothetical protein